MKPSMLVIDHVFHMKTKSFDFLYDLFKVEYDVVVHYVDPRQSFEISSELMDCEYVLICQLDFVTPYFVLRGKKVVVVQMYDGSAGLPDVHWIYNRQASYINFSLEMHFRALKNGCRSIYVQYFPDPTNFATVESYASRRLFFWERLPNSTINATRLASLLGNEVDTIHVHQSSDDRSLSSNLTNMFQAQVTTSSWFKERSDYEATLSSCNMFFAPRVAEGIGHAFLEAMAMGMIVVANDLPTHNEYITNWQNGILFNDASQRIDLSKWQQIAADIGHRARTSVVIGRAKWLRESMWLPDYVRQTPCSSTPAQPFLHRFATEAMADYQESFESYCEKLNDNPFAVQVTGNWQMMNQQIEQRTLAEARFNDKGLNFVFGQSLYDNLLQAGWSEPEAGHVWAVEQTSSVLISASSLIEKDLRLLIEVRALRNKQLRVFFSGRMIGCALIEPSLNYYFFEAPVRLKAAKPELLGFEVDVLDVAEPDPRHFAFMLRSIRLVSQDTIIDNVRTSFIPSSDEKETNDQSVQAI